MSTRTLTISAEVTLPNGMSASFDIATEVPEDITDQEAASLVGALCTMLADVDVLEPFQPITSLSN